MNRLLSLIVVLAIVPALVAQNTAEQSNVAKKEAIKKLVDAKVAETKPEAQPAEPGLHPRVRLETTLGDIVLELDAEKAPISVQNFIRYTQEGFYNDTIFHRVISTFMIQAGQLTADMSKKTEGLHPAIKNEWRNGLKNERGTIAMARQGGNADSATAQFFINVQNNTQLDKPQPADGAAYAVFGKVVEGMNVVDAIRVVPVVKHPKYPSPRPVTPTDPVIIKSATLISEFDEAKCEQAIAVAEERLEAARQKELAAQAEADAARAKLAEDIVAKTEAETGKKVQKTASGLMYVVLKEGDGASPKPTDKVNVHYTGWLTDGTKFDSSVDRGTPASFQLNRVIQGWTEGVGMMKVGGKSKLLIPYELAYGERGRPPRIPAKAMLVFDIELLGIEDQAKLQAAKEKEMEAHVAKLEAELGMKAEKTESGLRYFVLQGGEGASPAPTDKVKVHYTGWLTDGTKFDSSVDRGEPIEFKLTGVIRGWTEGVSLMKTGAKHKLVIPPHLGYGDRGAPPRIPGGAILVFDVELLDIK